MGRTKQFLDFEVLSEEDKELLREMGWQEHKAKTIQEREDEFEEYPETYWINQDFHHLDDTPE